MLARRRRLGIAHVAVLAAAACDGSSSGGEDGGGGDGGGAGTGDDTDGGPGPIEAADGCTVASDIRAGRWRGTLRGKDSSLGGACGRGGPDAFFRLIVPQRADVELEALGVGFNPRLGVLAGACRDDWDDAELLCASGLPSWILDLAAGTELVVSVGIDPADPALGTQPAEGEPDPLEFVVDVGIRRVLGEDEPCKPAQLGRCVTGTACLTADDGVWRCTALAADTCAGPEPVDVDDGSTVVVVDPAALHSDAHHHSCGGARKRERVLRLDLPPDVAGGSALDVRADAPDVALAVRLPGCGSAEEIACAPAGAAAPRLTIPDLGALSAAAVRPYLFVELPGGAEATPHADGDHAPFEVRLEVVPGA